MRRSILSYLKRFFLPLLLFFFSCCVSLALRGQGTLGSYSTAAISGSSNSISASNVSANILFSNLSRGSGINAVSQSRQFISSGWSASSIDLSDYYEFTISPNGCYVFTTSSVRFNLLSSKSNGKNSGGPTKITLRSSYDGYTSNIGSQNISADDKVYPFTFKVPSVYQNSTNAITFRLYGFGAENGNGELAILDGYNLPYGIEIDGSTSSSGSVGGAVSGGTSICSGSTSGLLTLSGQFGTVVKWQSSVSPFSIWTDLSNTAITYTSGVLTKTTQFRAVIQSGSCASANSTATTVNVNPEVSIIGSNSICVGETTQLSPSTGGKWVSNNPSVAKVIDYNGLVTGIEDGDATFTFTAYNPVCSATTEAVTVKTTPTAVTVNGGGTFCGSTTITASGGTGGTIYFQGTTSDGTSITTASSSQNITASGTYYFRSKSTNGCWGPEGSAVVTINPVPVVSITGNSSICVGETTQLSPSTGGKWVSNNSSVAKVIDYNGLVTGIEDGDATFTFTAYNPVCSATTEAVTVKATPTAVTVNGGGTFCGSTTITASGGTGGMIYFQGTTSGGTSITTASSSQNITASGTYYFRSKSTSGCWGTEGSAVVTINPVPVVDIIGSRLLRVNETTQLSPSTGGSWISNNPSVASVRSDNGLVTGISEGNATFTYTSYYPVCSATTAVIAVAASQNITPIVSITVGTYTYNGSPQGPNAATNTGTGTNYTFSYSGLGGTTYGPSATQPTNAGNYIVIATVAADGNYNKGVSDATAFTINKALLTITAGDQTVLYGTPEGTVTGNGTYIPTGFIISESSSLIGGSVTYTTTYTATTPAGTSGVTITPEVSGLTAINYSFTAANGTISIGNNNSTISVTGATSFTYSGSPQGPNTSSVRGSGGTVIYSYTGTGSTTYGPDATTPTNAGTYKVVATVPADANYNSATSSAFAFTINPALLTVTASDQTKIYGTIAPTNGTFNTNFTVSGLIGSDAVNSINLGYSGNPSGDMSTASVGSYTITPSSVTFSSGTVSNYSVTYNSGTLTVNKALLTVTANKKTKVYDGSVYSGFSVSYSGFINGDNQSVLGGALAFTGSATTAVNVGAGYVISPGGQTSSNYLISFVNGTLDISARPITITATAKTKVYGAADPPLTYTITSGTIANGDLPSGALIRSAGETVGTYAITKNALTYGTNYSETYVGANLTITAATLTVTADNKIVTYGDAAPLLTYTITGFINGDTEASVVTGTPALVTAYLNTTKVSSSPVTISAEIGGLASANYSFSFVNGAMTINPKALTITASNASKCLGDSFLFSGKEFTSSGLINGDIITSVTLTSAGADAVASAGSYPIVPSVAVGTGLGNYSINYENGVFIVNDLPDPGHFE